MRKLLWKWSPGLLNPLLCGGQEGCKVLQELKTRFPVPSNLTNRWLYKRHSMAPTGCFWRSLAFFSRFCVQHSRMHQSTSGRRSDLGVWHAAVLFPGSLSDCSRSEEQQCLGCGSFGHAQQKNKYCPGPTGSLDTCRVKQALGFWITAYDISSCLLYKCDIAPHLVLFGPDYAADYAAWLKSGHFASPYLCDMGLMMYLFSCQSPVTSL